MSVMDEIVELFTRRGAEAYFGERVTMAEHSLQAAYFAQSCQASASLVAAALLHDVGHLVDDVPEDLKDWVSDARHEESGSAWLSRFFGPAVCDPVRLHVPAKRYLCATEPAYFLELSPASVHTLALQGGAMSSSEVALFELEPYFREAVLLRKWDDQGKIAGMKTPSLESFRGLVESLVESRGSV